MSETESDLPPAGWYQEPTGGAFRWWDGSTWTEHRKDEDGRSLASLAPKETLLSGAAPTPSKAGTIIGVIGAVVLLFSTFSKWMTLTDGSAFNAFDRNLPWFITGADYGPYEAGTVGHGILLLLLAIAAIVFLLRASRRVGTGAGIVAAALGGVALIVVLVDMLAFRSEFGDITGASVGIGMWLALLAAAATTIGGTLLATSP